MDLSKALDISAHGMDAQTTRLRVIAENLAHQGTPGGDPCRRKTAAFGQQMDQVTGTASVRVKRIGTDKSGFARRYEPSDPEADAQGHVRTPNATSVVEGTDMREAQRSHSANLDVMQVTRSMLARTVELLT